MFNLANVFEGWKNVVFKSPLIEEMAMERGEICSVCPHSNTEFLFKIPAMLLTKNDPIEGIRALGCNICGCPLSSKVRVPLEKCPDLRWSRYYTKNEKMNTSNIHILKEGHQKQLGDIAQKGAEIAYKEVSKVIIENANKALQEIVKQRTGLLINVQGVKKADAKLRAELTRPTTVVKEKPEGEDIFAAEKAIQAIIENMKKSMATVVPGMIVDPSTNNKPSDTKFYTVSEEKIVKLLDEIHQAVTAEIEKS